MAGDIEYGGGVATSQRPPSELVTLLTDTNDPERWKVYPGAAPAGSTGKFVAIWPAPPDVIAVGLASEDWGQVRDQWQLVIIGDTFDECRWLRAAILARPGWGRVWELAPEMGLPAIMQQDYADPPLWQTSIVVRDIVVGTPWT